MEPFSILNSFNNEFVRECKEIDRQRERDGRDEEEEAEEEIHIQICYLSLGARLFPNSLY